MKHTSMSHPVSKSQLVNEHSFDAALAERLQSIDPLVGGMGATPNMGFAAAARPVSDDKD